MLYRANGWFTSLLSLFRCTLVLCLLRLAPLLLWLASLLLLLSLSSSFLFIDIREIGRLSFYCCCCDWKDNYCHQLLLSLDVQNEFFLYVPLCRLGASGFKQKSMENPKTKIAIHFRKIYLESTYGFHWGPVGIMMYIHHTRIYQTRVWEMRPSMAENWLR